MIDFNIVQGLRHDHLKEETVLSHDNNICWTIFSTPVLARASQWREPNLDDPVTVQALAWEQKWY